MQTYKLVDMASVIRSKNSGPYELTFDITSLRPLTNTTSLKTWAYQ